MEAVASGLMLERDVSSSMARYKLRLQVSAWPRWPPSSGSSVAEMGVPAVDGRVSRVVRRPGHPLHSHPMLAAVHTARGVMQPEDGLSQRQVPPQPPRARVVAGGGPAAHSTARLALARAHLHHHSLGLQPGPLHTQPLDAQHPPQHLSQPWPRHAPPPPPAPQGRHVLQLRDLVSSQSDSLYRLLAPHLSSETLPSTAGTPISATEDPHLTDFRYDTLSGHPLEARACSPLVQLLVRGAANLKR
ncbi:hypothetical protein CYFUS_004029 [Cystobacter fuscus]|uniref:Uncharacterized protein n=1 Tax=Cystobacter fuscus TaxID=43 RepID=A0A250J3Q6_9BACT|nr:hypothetical protein CYFUS_004029 [Cystobacter fuscus]